MTSGQGFPVVPTKARRAAWRDLLPTTKAAFVEARSLHAALRALVGTTGNRPYANALRLIPLLSLPGGRRDDRAIAFYRHAPWRRWFSCTPSEIRVTQLSQTWTAEARVMTGVDNRHRKFAQAPHGRDIRCNVRAW